MRTSSFNIFFNEFQRLIQLPEKVKEFSEAENLSLQPDSIKLPNLPRNCSSNEAIAMLSWLPICFHTRSGYQLLRIKEHFAELAYRYAYQGEWRLVQEIVESNFTAYTIWNLIREHRSDSDIFGNMIPLIRKQMRIIKLQVLFRFSELQSRKKVKKLNTRDYKDRGSLPPDYPLPLELFSYEEPREDRRLKVRGPHRGLWFPPSKT